LPKEAREEIQRRERDIATFVEQTAFPRRVADQFIKTVQPYMGMIQAEGGDPIAVVGNLLQTAAFLRTGPSAGKAKMVAQLVKDFGISIQDLDAALVGEQVPDSPDDKIARLIDQRLAPVNQLMQTLQQTRQQREQQTTQDLDREIASFSQDPANEFFKDVRNDMADLIELAERRGQTLTLKQAYDRAVSMNTDIQNTIRIRNDQKRQASSSVPVRGAAPTNRRPEDMTLRQQIEESMATLASGR
jgi:DNA-binding transcriptional MerR regulator